LTSIVPTGLGLPHSTSLKSLRLHLTWINTSDLTSLFSMNVTPSLDSISFVDCYFFSQTNLSNPNKDVLVALEQTETLGSQPVIPMEILEPFKLICPRAKSFELYQDNIYQGPFFFLLSNDPEDFDFRYLRRLAALDGDVRTQMFQEILGYCFEETIEMGFWDEQKFEKNKKSMKKMDKVWNINSKLENLSLSAGLSLDYVLRVLPHYNNIKSLRLGSEIWMNEPEAWNSLCDTLEVLEKAEKLKKEVDRKKFLSNLEKIQVRTYSHSSHNDIRERLEKRNIKFLISDRASENVGPAGFWKEWF